MGYLDVIPVEIDELVVIFFDLFDGLLRVGTVGWVSREHLGLASLGDAIPS